MIGWSVRHAVQLNDLQASTIKRTTKAEQVEKVEDEIFYYINSRQDVKSYRNRK